MATGKVLQFDTIRGYGFLAADDGGEDVFLHASVFNGDPGDLVPGTPLEFQVMAGDRGRKAFAVRFAEQIQERPATLPSPAADEEMCDVLSQSELNTELTELLLRALPALTGPQILEVRQGVLEFARTRGWVDA
jgi:cold shock protein